MDNELMSQRADAFAFIGNTLLKPITQTSPVGLNPDFWKSFPTLESEEVEKCCLALASWAQDFASENGDDIELEARKVAQEYTYLFVGPPTPAAVPWETFYCSEDVTVGFGEPTFEMKAALRDAGLEVSNDNNQYADHMGIELLLLSELCRRGEPTDEYEQAHPASWIQALTEAVRKEAPDGYYVRILDLAGALLKK